MQHFERVISIATAAGLPVTALKTYARLAPENRTPGLTSQLLLDALPALRHYGLVARFAAEASRGVDPSRHPAAATALELDVWRVCRQMACGLLQQQPYAFLPVPAVPFAPPPHAGRGGAVAPEASGPCLEQQPWSPARTFLLAVRGEGEAEGEAEGEGAPAETVVRLQGGGPADGYALRFAEGPRAGEEIGHLWAYVSEAGRTGAPPGAADEL